MDPVPVVKDPGLSPDAARTARQRRDVDTGYHPLLAVVHGRNALTKVHPQAPGDCAPDAPKGRPFTCGTCQFRVAVDWHGKAHAKCNQGLRDDQYLDASPRVTHGAATDVRAWWPACKDYQPKETDD